MHVTYVPGHRHPVLDQAVAGILQQFAAWGHTVQEAPDDATDLLLTSAPFGEPLNWRSALMFTARHRFKLSRQPTVVTLVPMAPSELDRLTAHFEAVLLKSPPDPEDYEFPGLAPTAYRVLYEQGHRGGPMLAIQRLVQAQAKSIRVLLVVGQDEPERIYHFDLVGAFPVSRPNGSPTAMYDDVVLRLTTCLSSTDIHHHQTVGEPVPRAVWAGLDTPKAMCRAGYELGRRGFFTDTVFIGDLTAVPAVAGVVASQYSEGCYATWEPRLDALIATVTGSARPVDKKQITEDELAVIVGVRPDYLGALVREVEGKRNDPPSSEAVEMYDMDRPLPRIRLGDGWPEPVEVPVIRSKLHGHRGIKAFDPTAVEYVPLDLPYLHYFVTCGTDSQARGVRDAFGRSQAMANPDDPRPVAFTILPGHGVVLAEKWVPGKAPFQVIWELMDAGRLVVDSHVPQGLFTYEPGGDGRYVVRLF
ncbi:MAG: hypothetical protein NZ528_05675 [Caldilineales bacterium]|nr:hypothetical protein [Caldilineales bacterium]MDW8318483.1 hypothetical protein [Anaerolineae bacterium]